MRTQAVDYLQQDLAGFADVQAAETLALVVDVTADEGNMQAMQQLLTKVHLRKLGLERCICVVQNYMGALSIGHSTLSVHSIVLPCTPLH